MKEKTLNILRIISFYPRKFLDSILFETYLKSKNNWDLLKQYSNKPILIVGNGPSLNKTPLADVDPKHVSIGMNKINLLYKKSSWRPEIITCVNGLVISQNKDYFNKTNAILIVPVKAFYLGVKVRKNVFFVKLKDEERIEDNIEKSVSSGCTVTFTALQIAAYLNPESVSIVGVDHSFTYDKGQDQEIKKFEGDDVNHFDKNYFKGQYWGVPNLSGSEILYKLSNDYFKSKNIPIKDYTIDGKLTIFEKASIEEILS